MLNRLTSTKSNVQWNVLWNESGSEGSTETLMDDNALHHMQRQEPQGQEQNSDSATIIPVGAPPSYHSTSRNNESNLSFGSSTNTLIIHHSVPDEPWSNKWLSCYSGANTSQSQINTSQSSLLDSSKFNSSVYLRDDPNDIHKRLSQLPSSYFSQSEVLKHLIRKDEPKKSSQNENLVSSVQSGSTSSSSSGLAWGEMTPIPTSPPLLSPRLPPPSYSHWRQENEEFGKDKASLSKSQPDLSNVGLSKELTPSKDIKFSRLHPLYSEDESPSSLKEMIDLLSNENHKLKSEIDHFHRKVTKLQKFEVEMAKVEEQHDSLVKMCERREQLERLARHKLHLEVRRLTEVNAELRNQIKDVQFDSKAMETSLHRASSLADDSAELTALRRELSRKETIISQLISQNRELTMARSELEKEILNKEKKLQDQQKQIDILDSALTSTQTTVLKLEEEVKKNENATEQVDQLKKLLVSMQRTSSHFEQSHRQLKQKYEEEIALLRSKSKIEATTTEILDLKTEIREKDERILLLEAEVLMLEQKIRSHEVLSRSNEALFEKSIEEKKTQTNLEQIRHAEELNSLTRRIGDLELRNRSLEATIAEREAKIKALMRKAEEKTIMPPGTINLNNSVNDKSISGMRKDEEIGHMTTDVLSYLSNLTIYNPDTSLSALNSSTFNEHDLSNKSFCKPEVNSLSAMDHCDGKKDSIPNVLSSVFSEAIVDEKVNPPPPYHDKGHDKTPPPPYPTKSLGEPRTGIEKANNFARENIRRSHRPSSNVKHYAPVVRRANSSCNRRSAPSPSSSLDSLEDAPSILERLKKEWEMGMLSGALKDTPVDGSKTLPYPLELVMNREIATEAESSRTTNEIRTTDIDKSLELVIREDSSYQM